MPNRIEAVVVCVDYTDFLAETLPFLLPHVDDVVVVTTPEDGRTKGVCHRLGVRCLPTHAFFQWGDKFNKARGINYGLANLRKDGWLLHLDADIALPARSRWLMNLACLDERKLYGVDRVNVVGRQAWDDYKRDRPIQYASSCRLDPPRGHELGSRLLHLGFGGYCPIGYFQLWHPGTSGIIRYPDSAADSAEHSDVNHAIQWDREDRELLPEIIAMHLVTKGAGQGLAYGVNWRGRLSPEFNVAESPYRASPPRVAKSVRSYGS
jgi:hypothetical protein